MSNVNSEFACGNSEFVFGMSLMSDLISVIPLHSSYVACVLHYSLYSDLMRARLHHITLIAVLSVYLRREA